MENFNYADYVKLREDKRYEVIDDQIYNMSPSTTPKHQDVITQLSVDFCILGENNVGFLFRPLMFVYPMNLRI